MDVTTITIGTLVRATPEKVWACWTEPQHIVRWNQASDDWHTTRAENDLRPGGKFLYRMEAKDGSFGFDFEGVYDEVVAQKLIKYTIVDGRKVSVEFISKDAGVEIVEAFEAEDENSPELQRQGWQAIIDNFRKYTELL